MAVSFFFFADGSPVRWDRLSASWFRDWPRNWFSAIVSISASRFRCFFSFFSCSSAFFNDFYWSSTAGLDVFPKIYTVRYYWLAVQGQVIGGSFLSTKYWISELATASARFPHRFHRFFAFFFLLFFLSLFAFASRETFDDARKLCLIFFFIYFFLSPAARPNSWAPGSIDFSFSFLFFKVDSPFANGRGGVSFYCGDEIQIGTDTRFSLSLSLSLSFFGNDSLSISMRIAFR